MSFFNDIDIGYQEENVSENMQNKNSETNFPNQQEEQTTIVYGGTVIHGDLYSEHNVIIHGVVKGHVTSKGSVTLSKEGNVEGNISSGNKVLILGSADGDISGEKIKIEKSVIKGSLFAKEKIIIGPESVVIGNLDALNADISGAVEGKIDIGEKITIRQSGIVKGDIKYRSIQMEDGALVDGILSQYCNAASGYFKNIA